MRSIFIIIIICIFSKNLIASFEKMEAGARESALGNAAVALENNDFAIYYNPANINSNNDLQITAGYRNFYNLPGIYQANLVINFPAFDNPFSFAVSKFGNKLYSELQLSFGSKFSVNKDLSVGASFQLYSLSISRYGEATTWGLNLGIQYSLVENLDIGAHISNINSPTIGKINETLSNNFSLGAAYTIFKQGLLLIEFYRDIRHEQDYRAGFEYEIMDFTYFRVGITDKTNTYNFGVGSEFLKFKFDYSAMIHEFLGISHSISLGVKL